MSIKKIISLYKREAEVDGKNYQTQTFFDAYVADFCECGGHKEEDVSDETLKELAHQFLEL